MARRISVLRIVFFYFVSLGLISVYHAQSAQSAHNNDDTLSDFATKLSRADSACTSHEKWTLSKSFPISFIEDFERGYKNKSTPIRSFSDAIGLRRMALTAQTKAISEYWISHALYQGKLPHIAFNGFQLILSRPASFETLSAQLASLACLVKIHNENPSISLPVATYARMFEMNTLLRVLGAKETDQTVLHEAALIHLQQQLSKDTVSSNEIEHTLGLLKNGGSYETLARALWASRRSAYQIAITEWKAFLIQNDSKSYSSLPESLRRFVDPGRILLARAYFGVHQYAEAAKTYKLIHKTSNELAESLSELAWAYLMDEQYQDSIGTATSLQAGAMRNTWAPEAPMVQAMAMNEICQYPESIRSIQLFRKLYEKPYRWLVSHQNDASYYKQAISYIKRLPDVPVRVGSEWVRSPLFLASQQEINLLFNEKKSAHEIGKKGAHEQRLMAAEILKSANLLLYDIKIAKKRYGPDEPLSSQLRNRLLGLKREIILYKRLMAAAPIFRTVTHSHTKRAPVIEKQLVARIDGEISKLNRRMRSQLEEISENVQLIEVEIYNGATHDIIWQNAHPEYRELAQDMEHDETPRSQVWDWGRTTASSDEESEIWEDELGAFKADLFNNCSSKNKYLALKVQRGR